jgi:hypothetical protein
MSKTTKTLAITAAIFAASASVAFAQSPPYGGYGNYYGGYGGPPPVGYNYGYGNYGYQGGLGLGPTSPENAAAQDAWLAHHPRALRALRHNYARER